MAASLPLIPTGLRRHRITWAAYGRLLRKLNQTPLDLAACRTIKWDPGRAPFKGNSRVTMCLLPDGPMLLVRGKQARAGR